MAHYIIVDTISLHTPDKTYKYKLISAKSSRVRLFVHYRAFAIIIEQRTARLFDVFCATLGQEIYLGVAKHRPMDHLGRNDIWNALPHQQKTQGRYSAANTVREACGHLMTAGATIHRDVAYAWEREENRLNEEGHRRIATEAYAVEWHAFAGTRVE